MIDAEILQKNAAYVKRLHEQANAVELGQLNELVRVATSLHKLLSPHDAANLYLHVFPDMQLISENFAIFLKLLQDIKIIAPVHSPNIQDAAKAVSLYYMENGHTESAREKFSAIITSIPVPLTDFPTICESVASDDNSFCILPVFSSTEGELPAFARMIREYQLKTRAMCDVTTSDGETELRFALLSGQMDWTPDAAFIEVPFQPDSGEQLTASLAALQRLGAKLYSINAKPMEYNMNSFSYKITVKVNPKNMGSIAAFIEAAMQTGASGVFNIL